MTAAAVTEEDARAIGLVNETLRGPVVDILQELLPQLRGFTRKQAYERIMGNPLLAATCFQEFRAKPDHFKALLVDAQHHPVTGEEQLLACGRSLAQVIALIVRAIAKRHFRARLGQDLPAKQKPPGLFKVIFGQFSPPTKPAGQASSRYARADNLYRAIRAFLLFDWQVLLIPHYARMPVSLVKRLGPAILDYKEASQIQALVDGTLHPEPVLTRPTEETHSRMAMSPPQVSGAAAPLPATAHVAKRDLFWELARQYDLEALFGCDEREARHLVETASTLGRPLLASLTHIGLKPAASLVGTCCVIQRLTPPRLAMVLASPRAEGFLRNFSRLAQEEALAKRRLAADINTTVNAILDRMNRRHG